MKYFVFTLISVLMMIAPIAQADYECETSATVTFNNSKQFKGAVFDDCPITVMKPQIEIIPGFEIDKDGNVVTLNWKCDPGRTDGSSLDCENDIAHYEVVYVHDEGERYIGIATGLTYVTEPLSVGRYGFTLRAVDTHELMSDFTVPVTAEIF